MQTKKERYKGMITRMLWNKKRDKIVLITILLVLIGVFLWKWDRLFVDFSTFAKIYLIAVGGGFCLGMTISYFVKIDLSREQQKHHQCMRSTKRDLQDLETLLDSDFKTKQIAKLTDKLTKLEAEWEFMKGNND